METAHVEGQRPVGSVGGQGGEAPARLEDDGGPPTLSGQYVTMEGLGLEALAAALATVSAQDAMKQARASERLEKQHQLAELEEQVTNLQAKADATRDGALVSGAITIGGGCLTVASVGWKADSATAKGLGAGGKTTADSASPVKGLYDARVGHLDADATAHQPASKRAESAADEYASIAKQASQTIEKVQSAIQAIVAERTATIRAVLRGA